MNNERTEIIDEIEAETEIACDVVTCPEMFEKLSRDENYLVRSKVASNLNASMEILEKLLEDKHGYVRLMASLNPKILNRY
ncbi:MAG: hypothetical protein KAR54_03425 [Candidatus Pacebacteria bacterium]|nr:hypothetical protein [Candidatus Paceibacterota bacterium]